MLEDIVKDLESITDPDLEKGIYFSRKEIVDMLKRIQQFLFPEYYTYTDSVDVSVLHRLLTKYMPEETAMCFLKSLPSLKKLALSDLQAIYDGDPAAKSKREVLICYPGFYAIFIYRIAHALHELKADLIPRILTEYAHEKTGIDIHPGATIQHSFCIDHGTGIVIGETATIGHHVKLYQGVTIGAKSFELDEFGNPVKSGKRHPDIGDYVVIYANATILGGTTKVGNHCVVGGNVWLTHSLKDYERILNQQ